MARGSKRDVKEEEDEVPCVVSCAVVVGIIGVFVIILGIYSLNSKSLHIVDSLIRIDDGINSGGVPSFTMKRVFKFLIGFGVAILLAAGVGAWGVKGRHKPYISCYVIFTTIVALIMFMATFQLFSRIEVVTPFLDTQMNAYCDKSINTRQRGNLQCVGAVTPPPPCSGVCTQRLEMLKKFDGCNLLQDMCGEWEYQKAESLASCSFLANETFSTVKTQKECQLDCDANTWCTAYVVAVPAAVDASTACVLRQMQSTPPKVAPVGWGWGANGTAAATAASYTGGLVADLTTNTVNACYTKTRATVLPKFHSWSRWSAWMTCILALALLISMIFTCFNLYNVNVKRKGKMGCADLVLTIFCPCAAPAPDEHLNTFVEDGAE